MIHIFRLLLTRKTRGISNFISLMICIPVLATVFVMMLFTFQNSMRVLEVERVHRQYLLSMEHEGYLTPELRAGLVAELTTLGASNFDFAGTSLSRVGYGQQVRLSCSCDVTIHGLTFSSIIGRARNETRRVHFDRTASAFY